jgi:hypothetical protein
MTRRSSSPSGWRVMQRSGGAVKTAAWSFWERTYLGVDATNMTVPLTKYGGNSQGDNMKKLTITAALASGLVALAIGTSGSANAAVHRTRVVVAPHYGSANALHQTRTVAHYRYAHTWRASSPNKATAVTYPWNTARLSYSRVKYR